MPKKNHRTRRLVGRAVVAGASFAGKEMAANDKKKGHKMRKLVGLAMVAGAAYAASRMMAKKKRKNTNRSSGTK